MGVYAKGFIKSEDEFGCKWYEEVYLRPFPYCHFLRDSCRGVEKCPLIEVPEPHGRLIDADKLHIESYSYNEPDGGKTQFNFNYVPLSSVKYAPTIIQASEEGE